ncbi:MAG: hypothetical protein QM699_02955 [Amaricoccus sp.]|uniref:hypothetical protein n=1 Tax=Amaricoccus sp. TaxID=1872485 RepID=UPI0039E60683
MKTGVTLAALIAAPLLLAACQHGGTTPSGAAAANLRDSQIAACKNQVASQNALPADQMSSVYDRETPMGTSVVNVKAQNGTFACEIGTDLSVKSITQLADGRGK